MANWTSEKRPESDVVNVRPYSYQPSRAELNEDISVDASPEEIRDALMRSVTVVESEESRS